MATQDVGKRTKCKRHNRPDNTADFFLFLNKEYSDLTNWTDKIQAIASLSQGLSSANEAKVRFLYRLGKILENLTPKEKSRLLNVFNISPRLYRALRLLINKFPSEEEAVEFLFLECSGKITLLFQSLRHRGPTTKNIAKTFETISKKIIGTFYHLSESDKMLIIQSLEKLTNWFPLKRQIDDKNFLRYSRCVCCGAEDDVYPLTLVKYPDNPALEYPVCNTCLEAEAKIDYKILAEIWGLYAYNIEAIFNKIHYGENP